MSSEEPDEAENKTDEEESHLSSSTDKRSRFDRFLGGGEGDDTDTSTESSAPNIDNLRNKSDGERTDTREPSQTGGQSEDLDISSISDRLDIGSVSDGFEHISQDEGSLSIDLNRSEQTNKRLRTLLENLTQLDSVTKSSQVLVLSPLRHDVTDRTCTQFFDAGETPAKNYLFITVEDTAGSRLDICQDIDRDGGETGVIEVGRDATDPSNADVPTELAGQPVTFKTVNSPRNLSKIGVMASRLLMEWENNDYPTVLCFYSLTELLEYGETQDVWEFLHILVSRLNSSNVSGHFHMDNREHPERTIQSFKQLFDLTLTVSASGDVDID